MSTDMRKIRLLSLVMIIPCQLIIYSGWNTAYAREYYFNPDLLELNSPSIAGADLAVFETHGKQAPGKYHVDLYLNGELIETRDVDFLLLSDATHAESLQPCLSADEFASFGVKITPLPLWETTQCVNLSQAIKDAQMVFRFDKQRVDISIPQAALRHVPRGYVSPDKWEHGIPAFLLNYTFSGASTRVHTGSGADSESYYLNLRNGINIGAWRFRNYSTWNRDNSGGVHWNSISSYLQRDIITLRSQLVMGDTASSSVVFDSVPFLGAQLSSDDDMLPDSLKGFAPVVRGIAKTNAQVTVKQNDYVIYQSYVSPGAFEITDLYPTSGSGDLEVTIKEADGSEQTMLVPYAAVPVLQREGRLKYSLASGQYKSYQENGEKPLFAQGTAAYGLPWGLTVYSGIQSAGDYHAWAFGAGKNLGKIGAISADVTQSRATINSMPAQQRGESWRVRYSKNFVDSGTNFSLAGYRYSTAGFYTLQDALDTQQENDGYSYTDRKKNRSEVSLSQSLWEGFGSLNLSFMKESYWNSSNSTMSTSLGYYNNWGHVGYGLNYTYSKNTSAEYSSNDQLFSLTLNLPLSNWLPGSYMSYGASSSAGYSSQNLSLNGSLLERNNLSYSVYQGYSSQGSSSSNVNLDYRGGRGEANLGYAYDMTQHRVNYGIRGGILLHENGLTLSQPLGETVILVKAPGANNTEITNYVGVETDSRGYAVVPYASAYRKTNVVLDTSTFGDDVDTDRNSLSTVPTRGAVTRVNFKVHIGQRVLMTLMRDNDTPVPFGAIASHADEQSRSSSIVADAGQVYLSGLNGNGTLQVSWGNDASQQCWANYTLTKKEKDSSIQFLTAQCLPQRVNQPQANE